MPVVNPEILTWARETSGLSVEDAARKLQLTDSQSSTAAEKLLAFENGKEPSRSLLLKMSKQYRKPLLAFYLEKPPQKGDRGNDFRTLPEAFSPEDDVYVDILIRDITARQSVLKEALIEEDEGVRLNFIGSENINSDLLQVAQSISRALSFDLNDYRSCKTIDEAFKYLRGKAESIGIFVLLAGNLGSHHSTIDTKFFRGFVLADEFAPFIVINDQDAKSAWSFTLLHELTHLWLGQTGVSGSYAENRIEKFCNDVASEILLPQAEFRNFTPSKDNFDDLVAAISAYAQARNISSNLVNYRLLRRNYIEEPLWREVSAHFKDQWLANKARQKERNKAQDGGPSYFVVRRSKLGDALIGFTERMTSSGALTITKAGLLLGVKPLNVHKLFEAGTI